MGGCQVRRTFAVFDPSNGQQIAQGAEDVAAEYGFDPMGRRSGED